MLEIPLAVMNHFVLEVYDEWEQKFLNACWKMYATLLDRIKQAGPSLAGKFKPCNYLKKAAEVLGIPINLEDHGDHLTARLDLVKLWDISHSYYQHYRKACEEHPKWRKFKAE